jgi:hypothetical protein
MRKLWRVLVDLVGILPWVVPIVVGFLAWLQQIPWYLIVLSVSATVVLVILGINQCETWKERHKKRFSQLSAEEIEDTIYRWVGIPFFKVQKQDIDKKLLFFQIVVTDPAGRRVSISRQVEKPSQLELRSSVETLLEVEKMLFANLEKLEQEQIIFRLKMEMARYGIGHEDINLPPDKIVLVEIVSLDDLVGGVYFRERITFVLRAATLCQATTAHAWRGQLFREFKLNVLPLPNQPKSQDK